MHDLRDSTILSKSYEIKEFVQRHSISDRETDVLLLLVNGITTTSDISERLNLSPNTISNHLNSLLSKTGAKNKAELLAQFLKLNVEKLAIAKLLCRQPCVLVVDSNVATGQATTQNLLLRGFRVDTISSALQIKDALDRQRIDLIVLGEQPNQLSTRDLAFQLISEVPMCPNIVVLTNDEKSPSERWPDRVVALSTPVNYNSLAFHLFDSIIESPRVRSRFQRLDTALSGTIHTSESCQVTNIGMGGACFAIPRPRILKERALRKCRKLEFSITLSEDETIKGVGEVCWVRKKDQLDLKAGLGIKFLDLDPTKKERLGDYVRSQKFLAIPEF